MNWVQFKVPVLGTVAALIVGWLIALAGKLWSRSSREAKEHYRRQKMANTLALVFTVACVVLLWARSLQHTSTFLGLIGAGLAVALREPLLSIAGRIAIFMGHMYDIGDRIEIDKMSGDVIDVGTFYTRMMEIGNWVGGDQPSGRIVQFSNSRIFGTPVFNYTQNFSYIWDEIKLPVTYASNVNAMKDILLQAASSYTETFLKEAESDLERMRHFFFIPALDLKPAVFMKVTDNWVELTLRYIVDPKKRRAASNFLFGEVFTRLRSLNDVQIASSTMDVTVNHPKAA